MDTSTFESKLFKSLTVGGSGCVANLSGDTIVSGLANDYVLLQEGFSLDTAILGNFNVVRCDDDQYPLRNTPSPGSVMPPFSWVIKFGTKTD